MTMPEDIQRLIQSHIDRTALRKAEVFKPKMMERFQKELRRSETARRAYAKLEESSGEPSTIRFFLTESLGLHDAGSLAASQPRKGHTPAEIKKSARECRALANKIQQINDVDIDSDNPANFLIHTGRQVPDPQIFYVLPPVLRYFADGLELWTKERGRGEQLPAIKQDAIQTLFCVYAEEIARLGKNDVAKILAAAAAALGIGTSPSKESLVTIASRYRHPPAAISDLASMHISVRRYRELKERALSIGNVWNDTYVSATGLILSCDAPIREVHLHLPRKQSGGNRRRTI